MATAPSYIPLRDDANIKSISKNERDFIRKCALLSDGNDKQQQQLLRLDGRSQVQSRPTRLVLTRYPHDGASGATLQWGTGTRVAASCSGDVIPPPQDRPNEGMVNINVELSPSASTAFRHVGPVGNNVGGSNNMTGGNRGAGTADEAQKLETNRILRALERLLSSCLDTEALVVTPGQWVWRLSLSIVVLDAAAGNLLDACWLATLAALQHYRQPHTEARSKDNSSSINRDTDENSPLAPVMLSLDAKEGTPLPLHQVPFAVSFALITDETDSSSKRKVVYLQDPSRQEEMIAAGRFTYALNVHQEICLVDFGGGAEIDPSLLREIHEAAAKQVTVLTEALQKTLLEADQQAIQLRLKSLKLQQQANIPSTAAPVESSQDNDIDLPPLPSEDKVVRSPDELRAEEEYRKQALDYNIGHVAQPLAEGDGKKKSNSNKGASALLASLLQTASQSVPDDTLKDEDVEMANQQEEESSQTEVEEPKKLSKAKAELAKMAMDVSDEEEETTMQLQSEFSQPSTSPPKADPAPKAASSSNANDDDDVDDLAAAIKTKKKKKKKK